MDDPKGTALAFVGTTNPVLGWKRLVEGVHCLAQRTDADLVIANTSGLLAGPGRKLKAAKIDAFQPDLLIALGEGPALETILNDHPKTPVLRLTASPQARRKTDGERRASRREAFRRYFAGASLRTLERSRLSIHPNDPLVPGLLLGLSDPCGNDQGLGLLAGPLEGTAVTILTPAAESVIHRITAGSLVLDEGFSEIRIRAPE
jgi:polynucleotide 5'-hydroxyl-kinase GRC3/NOL9